MGSLLPADAQIFPLSTNSWDNPEFVKRFLGSFGVNTRIEPEITREEATLFSELADIIGTDPNAAIARLRAAITPQSSAALDYTLGSLLLQQGDMAGAIRNYEAAIRKFPSFMRAYKNLGLALIQSNRFEEAIPMLVKAIELGDGDGNTFGLLGFAYLSTDRPRSALDAYRMAHMLLPGNRDWKVGLAQSLNQIGDYQQAAAILRELIQAHPDHIPFYLNRANALIAMGREMEAATHLEIVKRLGGANVATLRLLGDIYLNAFMPQLAAENYMLALAHRDGMPVSQALLSARNLVMFAAFDEAQDLISKIYEVAGRDLSDEDRVNLLNISAEIALSRGDDAEAAELLEQVIAIEPLNGRALILLGNYYNRIGNIEEAAFFYERAATIASVQVDALIQHARMLVGARQYAQAVTLLELAQSIRPAQNVENYLNAVRNARDLMR